MGQTSLFQGSLVVILSAALVMVMIVYYVQAAKRGKVPTLRRIPGLDAIEEAVGRSIEMGKPVVFSPGSNASLTSEMAPQTLAAVSVLRHVADLVASLGAKLIVISMTAESLAMISETVEDAYKARGVEVPPDTVRYFSESYGGQGGALGTVHREKPGAQIMIGPLAMDAILLTEAAAAVGALSISGTARTLWIPFLAVASDYTLIGEEIFVAGTYLSKDPFETGSIAGQDIGKMWAIALLVVGFAIALTGSNWFFNLLRM